MRRQPSLVHGGTSDRVARWREVRGADRSGEFLVAQIRFFPAQRSHYPRSEGSMEPVVSFTALGKVEAGSEAEGNN
jgi:hypothetical protein